MQDNPNNTIQLKLLTPLHIGTGRDIFPFEYFISDDDEFKRFSFNQFLSQFPEIAPKIQQHAAKPLALRYALYKKIKNNQKKLNVLYRAQVDESTVKEYERNIKELKQNNESNQLAIKEFIGNWRGKYIPGSTIKGAIRTAVLDKESPEKLGKIEFSNKYVHGDPFRYLLVTDSKEPTRNGLRIGRIKRAASVDVEYLSPELAEPIEFRIKYRKADLDYNDEKLQKKFSIANIIKRCNEYYTSQLEYALEIIKKRINKKRDSNKTEDKRKVTMYENIKTAYQKLLELPLKQNEFLLNIGWGTCGIFKLLPKGTKYIDDNSGATKTVEYKWNIPENKRIKVKDLPSTQWLIKGHPLGWVKCKIVK